MRACAFTCALIAALAAGCAVLEGGTGDRQAVALVDYANRVAGMSAAEQRRERDAALAVQSKGKSRAAEVKLGLLYALPATAIQDDARALALLEAGGGAAPGAVEELARFAAAQVRERQRQVQEEQRKAEALRQQLEALKAIERSIVERTERRRQERK